MKAFIVVLSIFICSSVAFSHGFQKKNPDPKILTDAGYSEDQIEKLLKQTEFYWNGNRGSHYFVLQPPQWFECAKLCPDHQVNLCNLAKKMIECFDTDLDVSIDFNEMESAINQLNRLERFASGGPQKWIDRFDVNGDGLIKPEEVLDATMDMCRYFDLADKYMFNKCKAKIHE